MAAAQININVCLDVNTPCCMGEPDPPDPPPGDVGFNFTQAVPAMTWNITHGRGYFPVVEVRDDSNTVVMDAGVDHVDVNNVQVTFINPTAGSARCV